jgi:hypothetical protein
MKTPKEVDTCKLFLTRLVAQAVSDWKLLRRAGIPTTARDAELRKVDHHLHPADAASLITFFNSPTVDRCLEAIGFPFTLADIRQRLEIPTMDDARNAPGYPKPASNPDPTHETTTGL